jgi:hypothetical protein
MRAPRLESLHPIAELGTAVTCEILQTVRRRVIKRTDRFTRIYPSQDAERQAKYERMVEFVLCCVDVGRAAVAERRLGSGVGQPTGRCQSAAAGWRQWF